MSVVRMLLLAAIVLAAAQPAEARHAPRLVPARLAPLQLHGSGFRRWERVRVTVTPVGGSPATERVRANRHGSFRVTFRAADGNGLEAVAVGRRGSRASFQFASLLGS